MKRYEKPGCPGWDAVPAINSDAWASVSTVTMKTAVLTRAESHSHGEQGPTSGAMHAILWVSALFLNFLGESKFRSSLN